MNLSVIRGFSEGMPLLLTQRLLYRQAPSNSGDRMVSLESAVESPALTFKTTALHCTP